MDILVYVDKFCQSDSEEIVQRSVLSPGGQAGNIACGLGKLDKKAMFFGNIGDDAYTPQLLRNLEEHNVDYSFAKKTDKPNSFVFGLIDKKGDRQLYAYNYINITAENFSDKILEEAKFVVFTSIIKDDAIELYVQIAKRAKEKNVQVALDPGNIFSKLGMEKLKPLLALCDYFFPSLSDIKLLTGGSDNMDELCSLVPNVIVTCGSEGVKLYKGQDVKAFPVKVIQKENIVDSVGAGDCFVAAFLSSLLENKTEEEAIRFANHAAALSITKQGASSMPTKQEVEEFMHGK